MELTRLMGYFDDELNAYAVVVEVSDPMLGPEPQTLEPLYSRKALEIVLAFFVRGGNLTPEQKAMAEAAAEELTLQDQMHRLDLESMALHGTIVNNHQWEDAIGENLALSA